MMSAEIANLEVLADKANVVKTYGDEIKNATRGMENQFTRKVETSENEAINKYIDMMNSMSNTVFSGHPINVKYLATLLNNYRSDLNSLGFKTTISAKSHQFDSYRQKVFNKSREIVEIAEEAKKLIDQTELTSSMIGRETSSFQNRIEQSAREMERTFRSSQDIKSQFAAKLDGLLLDLKSDEEKINRFMLITDPNSGIDPQMVVKWAGNGLTGSELEAYLNSIQKKDDAKAIAYLNEQPPAYEKVFNLDPDNLSDTVYGIMISEIYGMIEGSEYQVSIDGKTQTVTGLERMTMIINHLLSLNPVDKTSKHLNNLAIQTDLMAMQMAGLIAADAINSEGVYDEAMFAEWQKMMALSSLWTGLYVMERGQSDGSSVSMIDNPEWSGPKVSISELTFVNGESFTVRTSNGDFSTSMVDNMANLTSAEISKRMSELNDAKSKAFQNLVLETLVTSAGIFNPAIGVLGNFALDNNPYSQAGKLTENKDLKDGLNIAKSLAGYFEKINQIEKEYSVEAQKQLGNMFGFSGITVATIDENGKIVEYTDTSMKIGPGAIESMSQLEQNGLNGFMNETQYGAFSSAVNSKDNSYVIENPKIKELLLEGGNVKVTDLTDEEINELKIEIDNISKIYVGKTDELADSIRESSSKK